MIARKKKTRYYLFADVYLSVPAYESQVFLTLWSLGEKLFFAFLHARKVPVYYLNNGSRARVIVSPFLLSFCASNPSGYWGGAGRRKGEIVLFRVKEENRKRRWREERKGGQVPCRIAVMAKTELRRLKTRGAPPPSSLSFSVSPSLSSPFAWSRADRHGEFLGFSVIFYDFRIAWSATITRAASLKSA